MPSNFSLTGIRVLVLEDDSDSALLTQVLLEIQQAQVIVVNQATSALEVLTWFKPDLIVSDIMMPGIDGNSFMQILRAQGNPVPAIALSAAVYMHDQEAALSSGYNRFLEKPVDPDRLIATILELLPTSIQSDQAIEPLT